MISTSLRSSTPAPPTPARASAPAPAGASAPAPAARTTVRNDARSGRYTIALDDQLAGFADYRVEGSRIIFTNTEVDPSRRQTGLAGRLVEFALDDVRVHSTLTVVPQCTFVAHFIDAHPDYQELVDRG